MNKNVYNNGMNEKYKNKCRTYYYKYYTNQVKNKHMGFSNIYRNNSPNKYYYETPCRDNNNNSNYYRYNMNGNGHGHQIRNKRNRSYESISTSKYKNKYNKKYKGYAVNEHTIRAYNKNGRKRSCSSTKKLHEKDPKHYKVYLEPRYNDDYRNKYIKNYNLSKKRTYYSYKKKIYNDRRYYDTHFGQGNIFYNNEYYLFNDGTTLKRKKMYYGSSYKTESGSYNNTDLDKKNLNKRKIYSNRRDIYTRRDKKISSKDNYNYYYKKKYDRNEGNNYLLKKNSSIIINNKDSPRKDYGKVYKEYDDYKNKTGKNMDYYNYYYNKIKKNNNISYNYSNNKISRKRRYIIDSKGDNSKIKKFNKGDSTCEQSLTEQSRGSSYYSKVKKKKYKESKNRISSDNDSRRGMSKSRGNSDSYESSYENDNKTKKGNKRHRTETSKSSSSNESMRKQKKKKVNVNNNYSDDEIVHFSWEKGMILNDHYKVMRKMGDGTFGRVLLCQHIVNKKYYAVKVVRNVKKYTKSAKIEADILKKIQSNDIKNNNIVRYHGKFMYHDHMCLIFEPLGPSLYEIITKNDYNGFHIEDIKLYCIEILKALHYLRKLKLTHTDLKPENILLDDPHFEKKIVTVKRVTDGKKIQIYRSKSKGIKIIDFGCATFKTDYHGSIINTRQYRAPEVILNLGWDVSSDMWSFGCILAELYTGNLLFKTHEHLEHLALMENIIEPIPKKMLYEATKTNGYKYIDKNDLKLAWPENASSIDSIKHVKKSLPLYKIIKHDLFCDFLYTILRIDPTLRASPVDLLKHEFLAGNYEDF
ncbi:serine/threonine kinase-1, putative [Plasmodium berghei]|uniref:Serine/threonine kinase-1, putative n=2 Tax=Plasmodium berghei TaxID=5821 RepID=A0A509ARH7_PLABA|nr:serine/threonine kinase-1, putative [Plasmodium berghei ANKA]CXI89765.1 serine/threonine kinase-1, putative [Plasmodium berghei]SCL96121.1 serine/threonine kinase-1, putative [Plasmodium berghei]SCM16368.1 serine/threonine kinase-1, putative [Plasmodium berghei]SCM18162.1 serine/threonine kinase-1, putative [Plasmodium berghei]SCN27589.1 serine/threonine kinase-1, putative [Plasmodium berghei]|eukprot:XP_034423245.1 serine/threonine kinase-1, putative [Plasmodium berghei ANKA]